jgi:hypothetical protein
MPSKRTVSQVATLWIGYSFTKHLNVKLDSTLSVSGSGGQSFLEGAQFKFEDKWLHGHISISPGESLLGKKGESSLYFDSAHLTLPSKKGNYFYMIDGDTVAAGSPPKKFKGKYTKAGTELPPDLREDVRMIIKNLAGL